IRRIIKHRIEQKEKGFDPNDPHLPLNLQVEVVKPKWLCGTFAFHPMLGFRRKDQAASIAHGCKSTFERLAGMFFPRRQSDEPFEAYVEREADAQMRREWGQKEGVDVSQLAGYSEEVNRDPKLPADGRCWYRRGSDEEVLCPFAAQVVLKTLVP